MNQPVEQSGSSITNNSITPEEWNGIRKSWDNENKIPNENYKKMRNEKDNRKPPIMEQNSF